MSGRGVFISGTDTGAGKTRVSVALIHALRSGSARVLGFKPVASGCVQTPQGLRNDDALALQAAATHLVPYATINPCALRDPIAPHLAAAAMGVSIDLSSITSAYSELANAADWIVVEGAGGWRVPLGDEWFQAAIAQTLRLPVILVVGLRLGCINHALLSAAAIRADGCQLLGWVGNAIDPQMTHTEANLATLTRWLAAPCLGVLPFAPHSPGTDNATELGNAAALLNASSSAMP